MPASHFHDNFSSRNTRVGLKVFSYLVNNNFIFYPTTAKRKVSQILYQMFGVEHLSFSCFLKHSEMVFIDEALRPR